MESKKEGVAWNECCLNKMQDLASFQENTNNFHFVIYKQISIFTAIMGIAVALWLRFCATNRKVAGSIPAGVSGIVIDMKSFRSHYGPGVDSASNRNEHQEYFLGAKAAGA